MIDLVIAGGGPSGLAAGLYARRRGFDVLIVEPRVTPIDKACGEGLMPPAVSALGDLEVSVTGVPFLGIRYIAGESSVDGFFADGPGLGVRRTALHGAMSAAADRVGVHRIRGRVTGIEQHADGVVVSVAAPPPGGTAGAVPSGRSVGAAAGPAAVQVRAKWLIGADGLHSTVRRLAGIPAFAAAARTRFGLRRHYAVRPWSDLVEVHWAAAGEAYVTPVGADCVGVALLCGPGGTYADRLGTFPALRDRLAGASAASDLRGAGPLRQRVTRRVEGRLLLVGDAAGYVDALTGEGIGLGLATAHAAVDCLANGCAEDYERRWRSITRAHRLITIALLESTGKPALRRALVPFAARLPGVFSYAVNRLARDPEP